MARIAGVPEGEGGWLFRFVSSMVRRRVGKVSESLRIQAHQRWILTGFAAFGAVLERSKHVPVRLKRLAHLRVAMRVGCPG